MQSSQRLFIASCAVLVAMAVGCTSTTSTISGTIQQESFPAPVTKITVRSDKGDTVVPVDATGKFALVLQQGAEYQFLFSTEGKATPLIARAVAGRLDTTVRVRSGGAKVDMGNVTYFAGQRATDLSVPPPLASAEAAATCEDVDEEDGDNNQCENGLDPNGNACDGGPGANQDDAQIEETDSQSSDEMALPQYNLPSEMGCEDDDDDDDDETDDD